VPTGEKVPGGNVAEGFSITDVAPRPFFPSFLSMRDKRLSEQRNSRSSRIDLLSSNEIVDLIEVGDLR